MQVSVISHHLAACRLLCWSMSLQFLPYDLLFNIAQDLDIDDVHNLQAVSTFGLHHDTIL